jgi:hypothetical protein
MREETFFKKIKKIKKNSLLLFQKLKDTVGGWMGIGRERDDFDRARLESNFEEGDILGDEKDARKC